MKKYYTTLDIQNGQFIGTLFDATNNRQLYRTQPHLTQLQVTQELNTYIQTQKPVTEIQQPPAITRPTSSQPSLIKPMRGGCCGRK
jgi:hypothetical protein